MEPTKLKPGAPIELVNTFHGTTATVRPRVVIQAGPIDLARYPARLGLSHRQVLRARRKLCGIPGCVCGGLAGERGGRWWIDLYHQDQWSSIKNVYTLHDGDVGLTEDDRVQPEAEGQHGTD